MEIARDEAPVMRLLHDLTRDNEPKSTSRQKHTGGTEPRYPMPTSSNHGDQT